MKKNNLALLRMLVLVASLPAMSLCFISCDPSENRTEIEYPESNESEDNSEEDTIPETPNAPIYEAVDLGLSVKWASFNVGADSPEEYGSYFAWGETKKIINFDSISCITYNLTTAELQSRGIVGSDGNLTTAYDAATKNWGSPWRMPTLEEFKELIDNCTKEWTTMSGIKGYKVTGPNGNSIFLPSAGSHSNLSLGSMGGVRTLLVCNNC